MSEIWQPLIANLAVVALFSSIWSLASDWLDRQRWIIRKLCIGLLVGSAAVSTMLLTVEIVPGVVYDLRTCVVAVGAFFSGPVVAIIAIVMAGAFRLLEGGAGVGLGFFHLVMAALVGLGVRAAGRSPLPNPFWIVFLAAAMALLLLFMVFILTRFVSMEEARELIVPGTVLTLLATLMMGFTILATRRAGYDRSILRAALAQAPEFLYVKDTDGRFLTVNEAVAHHHGYAEPVEMMGKTDFDITGHTRAQDLHEQERAIMESRTPLLDFEEEVIDKSGQKRWYKTSKVPLSGKDGRIVGLAGMTVDTTAVKNLERELTESRDRLSLAMSEMSDGLALFDREGYLVFCNDQYRDAFPRSAHVRVPGKHIREILLECARAGEQLGIPENDIEGWAERVGSLLRVPNVVTVELFNGSYLQLRNQPASNDSAVVIVTDVTDLKLAERALIEANADLSRQASTDALTGLANRRVFDEVLERDMARCGRAGTPLSLVLLDVDRFKHYNDVHGHQAGDRCLIMVANAIKSSLLRPSDLAARYGGEEFAIILPDTNRAGAEAVAERIRNAIAEASTCELGSEVTASLGVAEYDLSRAPTTPESLVRRADGALYSAKAGGRNRVMAAAGE
ncbi:diguanylate cyclase [Pelagibacterium halotolerans]|uniref:diguanylate cyclase n=1 Tax=Pelagibacterium halotolerans (strain DSM 22347 / JCM 15775 / CGMCC 1.7692 / B2) TaxID=1082931 RepID=G4RF87_PELHB|nr:diguanylate cyclase [Pelagibacterium halotolerans]AEQ50955.1 diguanylate cyclase [Pelagibacterium halotolerans B2]SEA00921.1 PAS domain S-box-containing protein/diguanylate cyclase (GGDEF) domain-containing protein [Pelagibacterium halotolerans]